MRRPVGALRTNASNTPPFRLLQRGQEFRSVEFDDTNAWENGLGQKLRGQIGIGSDSQSSTGESGEHLQNRVGIHHVAALLQKREAL